VPKNVTVSLSETNFRKKPSLKRFIFSRFGGNELASLSMKDIFGPMDQVVLTTGRVFCLSTVVLTTGRVFCLSTVVLTTDPVLFSSTVVATTGLGNFDIFLQVV
jgi:hypothetical protein